MPESKAGPTADPTAEPMAERDATFEIHVAGVAGYCWGVRLAVDKAFEFARAGAAAGAPTFSVGPVIHNTQTVERLEAEGMRTVAAADDVPDGGRALVRAHGAPRGTTEALARRGVTVADATCPYVTLPQKYAAKLAGDGYHVVVVGDPDHAEIKGVLSHAAPERSSVVRDAAELRALDRAGGIHSRKVALLSQTTLQRSRFAEVCAAAAELFHEVRAVNTVCNDTEMRQAAAEELAARCDHVVVLGGRHSANTRHLADVARAAGAAAVHVERPEEVAPAFVAGARHVGITAGASTPTDLIDALVARLVSFGGSPVDVGRTDGADAAVVASVAENAADFEG